MALRSRSISDCVTPAGDFTCAIGSPMMATTRVLPLNSNVDFMRGSA